MKALKLTVLSLALVSAGAMANVSVKPAGVGVEVGTLGYGANLSWGVNETVELQAGWNGLATSEFDVNVDGKIAGIDVKEILPSEYENFNINLKGDVDFSNPYIGLQTRPFKNWLTVGTGVIVPKQEGTVTVTSQSASGNKLPKSLGEYELGDGDSITLTGKNKHKLAPYVTVGLRPKVSSRFGVFAEAGVAYMGDYAVNVDVKKGANSTTPDTVITDIKQRIDNKIDNGEDIWLPVVKLGATMRF